MIPKAPNIMDNYIALHKDKQCQIKIPQEIVQAGKLIGATYVQFGQTQLLTVYNNKNLFFLQIANDAVVKYTSYNMPNINSLIGIIKGYLVITTKDKKLWLFELKKVNKVIQPNKNTTDLNINNSPKKQQKVTQSQAQPKLQQKLLTVESFLKQISYTSLFVRQVTPNMIQIFITTAHASDKNNKVIYVYQFTIKQKVGGMGFTIDKYLKIVSQSRKQKYASKNFYDPENNLQLKLKNFSDNTFVTKKNGQQYLYVFGICRTQEYYGITKNYMLVNLDNTGIRKNITNQLNGFNLSNGLVYLNYLLLQNSDGQFGLFVIQQQLKIKFLGRQSKQFVWQVCFNGKLVGVSHDNTTIKITKQLNKKNQRLIMNQLVKTSEPLQNQISGLTSKQNVKTQTVVQKQKQINQSTDQQLKGKPQSKLIKQQKDQEILQRKQIIQQNKKITQNTKNDEAQISKQKQTFKPLKIISKKDLKKQKNLEKPVQQTITKKEQIKNEQKNEQTQPVKKQQQKLNKSQQKQQQKQFNESKKQLLQPQKENIKDQPQKKESKQVINQKNNKIVIIQISDDSSQKEKNNQNNQSTTFDNKQDKKQASNTKVSTKTIDEADTKNQSVVNEVKQNNSIFVSQNKQQKAQIPKQTYNPFTSFINIRQNIFSKNKQPGSTNQNIFTKIMGQKQRSLAQKSHPSSESSCIAKNQAAVSIFAQKSPTQIGYIQTPKISYNSIFGSKPVSSIFKNISSNINQNTNKMKIQQSQPATQRKSKQQQIQVKQKKQRETSVEKQEEIVSRIEEIKHQKASQISQPQNSPQQGSNNQTSKNKNQLGQINICCHGLKQTKQEYKKFTDKITSLENKTQQVLTKFNHFSEQLLKQLQNRFKNDKEQLFKTQSQQAAKMMQKSLQNSINNYFSKKLTPKVNDYFKYVMNDTKKIYDNTLKYYIDKKKQSITSLQTHFQQQQHLISQMKLITKDMLVCVENTISEGEELNGTLLKQWQRTSQYLGSKLEANVASLENHQHDRSASERQKIIDSLAELKQGFENQIIKNKKEAEENEDKMKKQKREKNQSQKVKSKSNRNKKTKKNRQQNQYMDRNRYKDRYYPPYVPYGYMYM